MLKKLLWVVFAVILLLLLMPIISKLVIGSILALAAALIAVKIYFVLTKDRSEDDG